MKVNDFIEFNKKRDLGAMVSDTYKFLREEWNPFFKTILKISLVPILLVITSIIFFISSFSDFFSTILSFYKLGDFELPDTNYGIFFIMAMIFLISYLTAYIMITASAMYYVKSYAENNGKIDYYYVKQMTFNKFWSFVAIYAMTGIMVLVGLLFCILPGLYFGIVLSLSSCLLVFSKKSAIDAIGDSFIFIKGHWWDTFGILLVTGLIVSVLNYITQIPATIYQLLQFGTSIFNLSDPSQMIILFEDPIYLLLLSFSYVIQLFFYSITLVVTMFVYFDIKDQRNIAVSH
tara:strand:- start:17280 stop:18149 length:870 start_codon:yes stop_codon:yes gene_type:complete